jgi:hypothetical protein
MVLISFSSSPHPEETFMPEEVFIVIVAGMVLGVPILGLTIRMVARPLAEAIATLKDSFTGDRRHGFDSMEGRRLLAVEEELDTLRKVVNRLAEAEEFREALGAPKASDLPTSPPPDPSRTLPTG